MRTKTLESRMEELLTGSQLEYFIAKHEILKGGKRRVVPVVRGLIFVHACFDDIMTFKQTRTDKLQFTHVRNVFDRNYATLTVPDKEMEDFIRVASELETEKRYYMPTEVELKAGQRIRIAEGPFKGVEGTLLKIKGLRDKRFVVSIPGFLSVATIVDPSFIQVVS